MKRPRNFFSPIPVAERVRRYRERLRRARWAAIAAARRGVT